MARTYTTISGDTWDVISHKLFESGSHAIDLIKANRQHRRTIFFQAGTVLNVPEIDTAVEDNSLPPWKRGAMNEQ